jgi:1-acyl-sn-glycerol-3-phosphate acyltransferase
MIAFLPGPVRAVISLLLYIVNTLFWCTLLFLVAFLKFILPLGGWRKFCEKVLNNLAGNWIFCNNLNLKITNNIDWDVKGLDGLKRDSWYLVLANHQSWVDILVLQKIFHKKIPMLKFFLKKELIWVPVLGLAWWALDFPFMKRYSRARIKKEPELKGKDIEITRQACQKFKTVPVSIMNFVEGTRFTKEKHRKQASPYNHLLKPKAGGVAFVLAAMGEHLHHVLDITIVYPVGPNNFWALLCGKINRIKVTVESLPLTEDILGDYFENREFRDRYHDWLNTLWHEKDNRIEAMMQS